MGLYQAWDHISKAAGHADQVLDTCLSCRGGVEQCFKQADFLCYDARGRDWVGWHDHAGESACFAVVLIAGSFEGGEFQFRNMLTGREVWCHALTSAILSVVCLHKPGHPFTLTTDGT